MGPGRLSVGGGGAAGAAVRGFRTGRRGWHSFSVHEDSTPGEARASLIGYLRVVAPTWEKPGDDVCAACASAADALERGQLDEISAAGRRFRIARIERYVRMGKAEAA